VLVWAKKLYEYKYNYFKHITTHIETAGLRNLDARLLSILRRPLSIRGLLKMRIKVLWRKETTDYIELKLLLSRIIGFIYLFFKPVLGRIMLRLIRKRREMKYSLGAGEQVDPGIIEFKRMFAGRQFTVVSRPPCINFLIARIDPPNFFGGYLAMFNFAKKFSERGYEIRILLTEQKKLINADLEKIRHHDLSLKDFLTGVEFLSCFSSQQEIPISAQDIFVATSVWTAHIAREAVSKTNYTKFIYITQEYEPIFFEHGSYRVLAEKSYQFNYFPFVSTDILQRYFVESGIMKKENAGICFKNPVLKFDMTANRRLLKREGKKKLLFYARPQDHATRNLYPLGCLAIDQARARGFFHPDEWEIIGIGGVMGIQKLPSGITIRHIGRFDLQKYQALLPRHDLGLALMYSPHPSLLPIEMAAAGMMVVTNTYGLKGQEYFAGISKNIKAVAPHPESLAQALIEWSLQVDDFTGRREGSRVNWPHDWDEALPFTAIDKAIAAVINSKIELSGKEDFTVEPDRQINRIENQKHYV
jgi:hypothetical protein